MNQGIKIVLSLLILWMMVISPHAYAQSSPIEVAKQYHQTIDKQSNPKGAFVTTQQGQILYDYNGQRHIDPASTTKLMTAYLVLEDVKQQKIHLTDQVKITSDYETMAKLPHLTTFHLKKNQTYTIEQLLKQAMLESSNAATLVLAHHIDGDIDHFTHRMNDKAKALGMTQTHFTNPSGANNKLIHPFAPKSYKQETTSKSTSQDMAVLAHTLVQTHPEILNYSKLETDQQYHKKLKNTNLSLPHASDALSSADGLKTGTSENGYNLVLSATQHQLRIHTVIMNVLPYPNDKAKHARQKLANALTLDAMKQYEYCKVISKGHHTINDKPYDVKQDLYDVVPKDKSKYQLKIKNHRLQVDYPRTFLKGTKAPSVKVEPLIDWHKWMTYGLIFLGMIVLAGLLLFALLKWRKKQL